MADWTPLDLLAADRWTLSAFTTYSLSLSFFEALVLDPLVRKRSEPPTVLTDLHGLRSALAEYGARRVGRDYEVEPVERLGGGVFHPKVSVLANETDAHLLVGSGNLTFGGWGGNLECVEHLHPSFAGDAFLDGAAFFRRLAEDRSLRHAAADRMEAIADRLRRAGESGARNSDLRLIHSLGPISLAEQLAEQAETLGGATALTVAAPFWDHGAAVGGLCRSLGLDHVFVHAHEAGVVETGVGENWPRGAPLSVAAVRVEALRGEGLLHAKLFELVCARGRIVMSGSANATGAALDGRVNVEACLLRIDRTDGARWLTSPASPLAPRMDSGETVEVEADDVGVLRAVLRGDVIEGRVMTAFPAGPATCWQMASDSRAALGEVEVGVDGGFRIRGQTLGNETWNTGRMVLCLVSAGREARGFVSFSDLQALKMRAGHIAPSLLPVLQGTASPADLQAVLAWFNSNPDMPELEPGGASARGAGPAGAGKVRPTAYTDPALLLALGHQAVPGSSAATGGDGRGVRFVNQLFASLTAIREAPDEEDDDDGEEPPSPTEAARREQRRDKARRRAAQIATRSFDLLGQVYDRFLDKADWQVLKLILGFTQAICTLNGRDTDRAREYLTRLVPRLMTIDDPEAPPIVGSAVLVLANLEPRNEAAARRTRRRLMAARFPVAETFPGLEAAGGFQRLVPIDEDFLDFWRRITQVRTAAVEVRAYRAALADGRPADALPILRASPEWPALEKALTDERARRRLKFVAADRRTCPCDSSILPVAALNTLRNACVAGAPCGHVLLCEEV